MEKEFIDYFENLDFAIPGNTYDWFSLKIDLRIPIADETISKLQHKESTFSQEELNSLHYLIHEYIHFLQNTATNWGGPVLTDYALSLMKIGASSAQHETIFTLPINFEKKSKEIGGLFESGYELFKTVKDRTVRNEGTISFNTKNTFPDHQILPFNYDEILVITNGRLTKNIGLLTIRESMAHVGALLFLNFSDKDIHDLNICSKHFCSSDKLLDKSPEYWILFEYFFVTDPTMSNIGKGVFALCAEALTKLNPDKAVNRFFDWYLKNKPNSGSDLFQLIKTWSNTTDEQKYYIVGRTQTLNHLASLISLCQRNKKDNFIFECFEKLYLFVQNNLSLFDGGRGLYLPNADLSNKRTWFMFLYKIGSPLIRYKNNIPIIYGPSAKMETELVFLLGLSKTLSSIQISSEFKCVFLEEYNICNSGHKEDFCLTQPYKVTNPLKNGEECIFNNCMKLLGFEGRLQE